MPGPVRLVVEQRSWQGSILSFSLTAQLGLLSTPIKGTVEVTDQDLTLDADLGLLSRLVPENTAPFRGTSMPPEYRLPRLVPYKL
jgi:hypothetical protein